MPLLAKLLFLMVPPWCMSGGAGGAWPYMELNPVQSIQLYLQRAGYRTTILQSNKQPLVSRRHKGQGKYPSRPFPWDPPPL